MENRWMIWEYTSPGPRVVELRQKKFKKDCWAKEDENISVTLHLPPSLEVLGLDRLQMLVGKKKN